MTTLTSNQTELTGTRVGKIVAQVPATARVFEKHQIDYCCQGNKTLGEACVARQLDPAQICRELDQVVAVPGTNTVPWSNQPLGELCDHIVARHHDYLREELPRLSGLIDKVVQAHGESHPELLTVKAQFRMLRAELEPHMAKEEQILFPAIRALEQANRSIGFPFGSLGNPIRCMEHEHAGSGEALSALRQLTNGYQPPLNACPTYRVMLDSLARLELDLHEHIHKENQILFPRAQDLERQLANR